MVRGNSFTNCPHYSATDCIVRKGHIESLLQRTSPHRILKKNMVKIHFSARKQSILVPADVQVSPHPHSSSSLQGKRRFGCCDQHHKLFSSATAQH